ncbi:histidine phosphatase family protein [Colwellia sp. UCD-KL20]|uniref:histidine phosphatase family protein n=1 Tax=Colwellia sp. UCD-KL20 TaxID=1917165 RepID=UPI00097110B7|nr:histidine phosphatase family protein [Colwellia sp. UCD-KL20]
MEIILVRHGKPTAAVNKWVGSTGYKEWVHQYHLSPVSSCSYPSQEYVNKYQAHFIVSSQLNRGVHSANIFMSNPPNVIEKSLNEMDLPYYNLPVYMPVMVWLYLCRIFWLLRFKGHFETYKQSKIRSIRAALTLIRLAEKEEKIVVFGHGLINRFIRKVLVKKGWKLMSKNSAYWGITQLKKY